MPETNLLHELVRAGATRSPGSTALTVGTVHSSYGELSAAVDAFASGLLDLGLERAGRVAIWLEKRFETVVASFAAPAAGGVFVPLNPLLKPEQVAYIASDCSAAILVTSPERLDLLLPMLARCPTLRHIVLTDPAPRPEGLLPHVKLSNWADVTSGPTRTPHRRDRHRPGGDPVARRAAPANPRVWCFPTATWCAAPRVLPRTWTTTRATPCWRRCAVLRRRLQSAHDRLSCRARVILLNYLMPRDVLKAMQRERVTGLTAVPPLYIQLSSLEWPEAVGQHLRYFANTGGRMPLETLKALRARVPKAKPFLMYGLTEAFRSTYLPPEEVDRRPESIGKAIPNAEILVLREDGTECGPNEPGELVHRGALVGQGYWNDPAKRQSGTGRCRQASRAGCLGSRSRSTRCIPATRS